MRQENMRLLDFDFDDDGAPHTSAVSHAISNDDPFVRPDYRGKRHTRPVGRVMHKRKPRRARVQWVEAGI